MLINDNDKVHPNMKTNDRMAGPDRRCRKEGKEGVWEKGPK